jgi:uncharacterized protein
MSEDLPEGPDPGPFMILAVLIEGGLAPFAVLLGVWLGHPALSDFAWRAEDAVLGAAATAPMLALLLLIQRWPVGPFRSIQRFFDEEIRPFFEGCTWPDLALMAVAAGVGEEMLFRGVLQGAFSRRFGLGLGWGIVSLLFGLLHPYTPSYIVIAALLGAYLGGVMIYNGNLLTVMVTHALYDFVALVLVLREKPAPSS